MHDGRCSTASKRRKRSYSEVDNNDNDNNDNNTVNTDDTVNANNNTNNNDSLFISLRQHQMRAPHLNIDEHDSSSSTPKSSLCDRNTSILLASSALSQSGSEQEKRIMLAKIGDWEPITLSSLNGKSYHFLTSLENIQDTLVDQPAGQWTLLITTETVTGECTTTNSNHLF